MSFLKFADNKDKGIGIGLLCILPVLLLVVFAISFSIKTSRDLCNVSNWECGPPSTVTTQPSTITSTKPNTPPSTQESQPKVSTQVSEKFDVRTCGAPTLKPGHSIVDSSNSIKTYKWASLGFLIVTMVIIGAIGLSHKLDFNGSKSILFTIGLHGTGLKKINLFQPVSDLGMTDADNAVYRVWFYSGLFVILPLIISTIAYLTKNDSKSSYTSFSLSFINLLLALILAMFFSSEAEVSAFFASKPSGITSYAYFILLLILIIFVIGTIYFHTSEESDIEEGKITYAINESVVNMMPPIMLVIALASLLIGGSMVLTVVKSKQIDKLRLTFGITQLISGILLIAGAAYFYNYKAKCSSATVTCDYTSKNINRTSGEDMCVPDSGMSMTHEGAVGMSTALSVIMSLVQIVGSVAVILLPAGAVVAAATTATHP